MNANPRPPQRRAEGLLRLLAARVAFASVYRQVAYLVIPGLNGWATVAFLDRGGRIVPLVKFSDAPPPAGGIEPQDYLQWTTDWAKAVPAGAFLAPEDTRVSDAADALRVVQATRRFVAERIGGLLPPAVATILPLPEARLPRAA